MPCPVQLSHLHTSAPCLVGLSARLSVLPMTSEVGGGRFIIVVGEIEVNVNSTPDGLPNLVPTQVVGSLGSTLPALLATGASA